MLAPKYHPAYNEFCRRFDTEKACEQALFEAKWPNGFVCPVCRHSRAYSIRTRRLTLFECVECRHQTTVIAGTIMEGSRTSLMKWMHALILHVLPSGYSAKEISRILEVTYKTAWLICHKIRHAMGNAETKELLTGLVRIQPSHYRRVDRTTAQFLKIWRQPVLAAATISEDGNFTDLRIRKIAECEIERNRVNPDVIRTFVKESVDSKTVHPVVVPEFYGSDRSPEFTLQLHHARAWINGVYSGGVGEKHLQAYLDQYCFRFPERQNVFFDKLLKWSLVTPRISYPDLIHKRNTTTSRRRSNLRKQAHFGFAAV
ncbi:transposase [Cohnella candidum]|uniref:transposase n=1 Tax=Cohnella candidum TaxID=2674991 RepID=UPI0013DE426D|nr:transposase [Cohnella candidum]